MSTGPIETIPVQPTPKNSHNRIGQMSRENLPVKNSTPGIGSASPRPLPRPLPRNASAVKLSNSGVQSLKQGNLPYAFRCLNAAAKIVMQRRLANHAKAARKRPHRGAPFTMVTRSSKAKLASNATESSGLSMGAFPNSTKSSASLPSGYRFDWLDCTKTYLAVKRYADANYNNTVRPGGMGTEFLCLRFIVVVPNEKHGSRTKFRKSDIDDSFDWVVWYNTAIIFHLVAEQRGEYGSSLLPKAQALLQMAGSHVNRLCASKASGTSMSQWHMARLVIWNNLAALYHERAMMADTSKMTRLIRSHVAGFSSTWHDDGRWSGNEHKRDAWLCRLLLTHALAMGSCLTAGAA